MKIETYEIEPETTEIGQLAADGEAREICERLGLSGQLSLSNNESNTVFPYRRMTRLEQVVFELHCPHKTRLEEYKSDAIPVRVLQVAAHATDCNFLKYITVWHPTDAKLDPVLVGNAGTYGNDLYLLARWGTAWKDFSVLLDEARTTWKRLRKAKLDKALREVQQAQATLDADAELYFSDEHYSINNSVYF